jgi:hypothetical protein
MAPPKRTYFSNFAVLLDNIFTASNSQATVWYFFAQMAIDALLRRSD